MACVYTYYFHRRREMLKLGKPGTSLCAKCLRNGLYFIQTVPIFALTRRLCAKCLQNGLIVPTFHLNCAHFCINKTFVTGSQRVLSCRMNSKSQAEHNLKLCDES